MERQTLRKIYLVVTGLKLTGLLIYGAFHSASSSGNVPEVQPTSPAIEIGSEAVNRMFDDLDSGIPMIGPKGESILIRDPKTGAFSIVPATPRPMPEP